MKKTVILVADPEIPRAVPGDGMHVSAGHAADGNKPAILEVGDPAHAWRPKFARDHPERGTPTPSSWQSTASLAVNRNLPVLPSVQAIDSAKPNAAIPGRQNGHNVGIRQTLLHRNRGDGEVAKAVEAISGGYPNIAFTILKETYNVSPERPSDCANTSVLPWCTCKRPRSAVPIHRPPSRSRSSA